MFHIPTAYKTALLHIVLLGGLWFAGHVAPRPVISSHLATVSSQQTMPAVPDATFRIKLDGTPGSVVIPRFGIARSVIPGVYDADAGTWNVSYTEIQYITSTDLPSDQPGNTVLYGHNTRDLLTPTQNISVGDELVVIATNGIRFHYKYVSDDFVQPSNLEILTARSATPRVVLITCAGVWNEYRRLMYFDLDHVEDLRQPTAQEAQRARILNELKTATEAADVDQPLPWNGGRND